LGRNDSFDEAAGVPVNRWAKPHQGLARGRSAGFVVPRNLDSDLQSAFREKPNSEIQMNGATLKQGLS
jgi:hypothetical protein